MSLRALQIGNVTLDVNLLLAPMSGITNSCFRRLIRELNPGAVGLVITEFISVEALTRQSAQSLQMMRFATEEQPVAIQIFGYDVSRMVEAAQMVEEAGAVIVDINCGCPVPKVVKRGGGCELMRQPEHLEKLLRAVRGAVSIPVTLKIRSGWDEGTRNCVQIAKLAEDCGIAMLTIHGRTRSQLYRGKADWNIIEEAASAVRMPVIGSGDVVDFETAKERLAGAVSGLMIGRQALLNPWVFSDIQTLSLGAARVERGDEATAVVLQRYIQLLTAHLPARAVTGRFKQLASQMTRRVRGSSLVRRALCQAKTVSEIEQLLWRWRESLTTREQLFSASQCFVHD